MKHPHRRHAFAALVLCLALAAACDTSRAPTLTNAPDVDATPLTATSSSVRATLAVGDTADMFAYSTYARATAAEGHVVAWRSTATAVVAVNSAGLATAKSLGMASVIASYLNSADTVVVTVAPNAVATITLSASQSSLVVGQTATLTAVARTAQGVVIPNPVLSYMSSATTAAAVSAAGIVTATGAGNTTISVTSGSASASVNIAVTSGSPPPGAVVSPPQPPQLLSFTYPVRTGKSWILKPTDNLQNFLNSAQRGDEIVLPAGATYTGQFVLPAKPGTAANGWILLRTDKTLPPQGTRVTPAMASLMPRIVTDKVSAALATAANASGWWISGLEITISPALTAINYGIVLLGDGSFRQTSLAQVPSDLVLERSYVHGATTSNVSRCVGLNSARTAIMDSYLHECHLKGYDSQAIAGWNGPGPFKIVNNTLAGAGENVMFGGSDPQILNLIPSDIEIRRNYIYTPASWKGVWTKKNLIESKNSQRVLVEANVMEGSWRDGQVGYAVLLKSASQSGRCTWCATRDWEFRNNIIRNVGAGFNLAGREGSNPYPVGELLTRVWLEQNILENVNVGIYQGDQKMVQLLQNLKNLTMRNNSMYSTAQFSEVLAVGSAPAVTNMEMTRNSASYGTYGLFASASGPGEASLLNVSGIMAYSNQVFVGPPKVGYPRSTFVSSIGAVPATIGALTVAVNAATAGVVIP